jgi:probable F420-dependent oxidoreductase
MAHPFRFGALEVFAPTGQAWADTCRRIEDHGFSTLQIVDHLGFQFAPIPALTAAAAATTTLRLATQVFDNDYRHPVMLAKECATLDLLSNGRLELGIGAGWDLADYDHAGFPFDRAGVRIDRLEEALQVLRGCFAEGPFSFSGTHYTITDYEAHPQPVQKAGPPILIGGGAKRMLGVAGREADIVGLNFDLRSGGERHRPESQAGGIMTPEVTATGTAEAVAQKLQWVRDGAGDRYEQLEFNVTAFIMVVTDDRDSAVERLSASVGVTPETLLELPFALVGSVSQIVDTLVERRERFGINYITFPMPIVEGGYEAVTPIVAALAGT